MHKPEPQPKPTGGQPVNVNKQPYETPVFKEHGSAKSITLQTFFGTFSPPASD